MRTAAAWISGPAQHCALCEMGAALIAGREKRSSCLAKFMARIGAFMMRGGRRLNRFTRDGRFDQRSTIGLWRRKHDQMHRHRSLGEDDRSRQLRIASHYDSLADIHFICRSVGSAPLTAVITSAAGIDQACTGDADVDYHPREDSTSDGRLRADAIARASSAWLKGLARTAPRLARSPSPSPRSA